MAATSTTPEKHLGSDGREGQRPANRPQTIHFSPPNPRKLKVKRDNKSKNRTVSSLFASKPGDYQTFTVDFLSFYDRFFFRCFRQLPPSVNQIKRSISIDGSWPAQRLGQISEKFSKLRNGQQGVAATINGMSCWMGERVRDFQNRMLGIIFIHLHSTVTRAECNY